MVEARRRFRARLVWALALMMVVGLAGPVAVRAEQSQIPAIEYEALEALYNATGGAGWTTPWSFETDYPCSLSGVTCYLGHVWDLNLYEYGLSGELPPELANLSELRSLILRSNALTGTISPAITSLTALQALDLGDNQLSGPLPADLANLTDLSYLTLYGNALTGEIPPELAHLTGLSNLDLANNALTGAIPPELGSLTGLSTLNLGGNDLTGTIPPELGNLTNLRFIFLYGNQLSGDIPPEFAGLTQLVSLSLGENQLTGALPAWLGSLSNLFLIGLADNHLSGPIPPEIGNLTNLSWLTIGNNALVGPIPPELANLTNISMLDLGDNMLWSETDALAEFLAHDQWWTYSQTLSPGDVVATPLGGGVELTWTPSPHMNYEGYYEVGYSTAPGGPYTRTVRIGEYDATGVRLSGLPQGVTYYLVARTFSPAAGQQDNDHLTPYRAEVSATTLPGQSQIPDDEYAALRALYDATGSALWAIGWSFTGSTPCADLPGVTCADEHVVGLSLPNRNLSGALPAALGDLAALRTLNLSGNALSGALPPELGNMAALQSLNLGGNVLTGTIPSELGSLSSLVHLYLDGNQLEGPIPPELGQLDYLRRLSLAGNRLSGPLPPEMGNLSDLYWLNLRDNRLEGPLPASLASLTGITTLDLGYNAFWVGDDALADLLSCDPDWAGTQAAPQGDLSVTPLVGGAHLTWTPGPYRPAGGYYEVGVATAAGGPYTTVARIDDLTVGEATVDGLRPGRTYFAVRTYAPGGAGRTSDLTGPYGPGLTVALPGAFLPIAGR